MSNSIDRKKIESLLPHRAPMLLIDKLVKELKEINYQGSVVLCGYGEPMLHKDVYEICRRLSEVSFVEIVTNGDTLTKKKNKRVV